MGAKHDLHLAIFNTFKTKTAELTGEAVRQRDILRILAIRGNPADRTRTAISRQIAKNDTMWKNIYSGVFRDLDEILIPRGVVEESGRLPLTRGPRALQERGIPYYRLTRKGKLISLALPGLSGRRDMLKGVLSDDGAVDGPFMRVFLRMEEFAPRFTYSLLERYIKAYCEGTLKSLFPLSVDGLKATAGTDVGVQEEFILGFMNEPEAERDLVLAFLHKMVPQAPQLPPEATQEDPEHMS